MSPSFARALRRLPAAAAVVLCTVPGIASAGTLHAYLPSVAASMVAPLDLGPAGELTPNAAGPVPTGSGPLSLALTPDAAHVYVVDNGSNMLSAYDVLPGGGLTFNATPAIPTGPGPLGIAMAPDGKHAYVAVHGQPAGVSIFDVSPTGTLTENPASPFVVGNQPSAVALTPDGAHAYLSDAGANAVYAFDVSASGALTPNASPSVTTTAPGPDQMSVSPDGKHLYASTSSDVDNWDIGPDGALTPNAATPSLSVSGPKGLTTSPDALHLYVVTLGGNTLETFDVAANGGLTPNALASAATGTAPFSVTLTPGGTHAYSADVGAQTITRFDIGPGGGPTPSADPPLSIGGAAFSLAFAPSQPASAALGVQPARAGQATSFDASGSTDSDGAPARYDWDFGDGTTLLDGGATPAHIYAEGGTYTVRVTVVDDQGCSGARTYNGVGVRCNAGTQSRVSVAIEVPRAPRPPAETPPAVAGPVQPVLPVILVTGKATTMTARAGSLTVPGLTAVCTKGAGPCDEGSFAVNTTIRGLRRTLGRRTLKLADGAESPVALTLSAWGRRSLARHRSMRVTAEAVLRNSRTGAQAVYVKNLTLKAAPKKKRRS